MKGNSCKKCDKEFSSPTQARLHGNSCVVKPTVIEKAKKIIKKAVKGKK